MIDPASQASAPKTAVVIGTGLIGTSVALALRAAGTDQLHHHVHAASVGAVRWTDDPRPADEQVGAGGGRS